MHHQKYTKRERSFGIAGLIWVATAIPFVALVQHDQFFYAILELVPIGFATGLILKITRLMEEDDRFTEQHAQRLAKRPKTLCDVDRELSADIRRVTRPHCPRQSLVRRK